jgi:hypothetical protein
VTPEQMRARAAECEEKSRTHNPKLKEFYKDLARQWLQLAEDAEKRAKPDIGT